MLSTSPAQGQSHLEEENRRRCAREERLMKRIRRLEERCSWLETQNQTLRSLCGPHLEYDARMAILGFCPADNDCTDFDLPFHSSRDQVPWEVETSPLGNHQLLSTDTSTWNLETDNAVLPSHFVDELPQYPPGDDAMSSFPYGPPRMHFVDSESPSIFTSGTEAATNWEALTQMCNDNEPNISDSFSAHVPVPQLPFFTDSGGSRNVDIVGSFSDGRDSEETAAGREPVDNHHHFTDPFSPNATASDYSLPSLYHNVPGSLLDFSSPLALNHQNFPNFGRPPSSEDTPLTANAEPETDRNPKSSERAPGPDLSLCENLLPCIPELTTGFNTSLPKWKTDKYILSFRLMLKRGLGAAKFSSKELLESLTADGITWIIREAWPEAEGYWKLTASFRGFLQSEIWRNFPCQATYANLHPAYRPTVLQLKIPHSPVIDWLPWPDLRDRVIMYQDQIDVDTVCRTAIQNVLCHRTGISSGRNNRGSGSDENLSSTFTSFRIWDLYLLEKQTNSKHLPTADLTYTPSSASVVALKKAYGLVYDDFTTQKLHPRFFERYPFLYCESAVSKFQVQEMQAVIAEDVGHPRELGLPSVERLRRMIGERVGVDIVL